VKNRHKNAKKQNYNIYCVLLLLFFGSNKVHSTLETRSTKATEVGESNKVGVWGRSPQPPETKGVSVVDPPTVCYFCYFLEEIK